MRKHSFAIKVLEKKIAELKNNLKENPYFIGREVWKAGIHRLESAIKRLKEL